MCKVVMSIELQWNRGEFGSSGFANNGILFRWVEVLALCCSGSSNASDPHPQLGWLNNIVKL